MTLGELQKELKAPKDQKNEFGGFVYRSAEDILDKVKSLIEEEDWVVVGDELVSVGDRYYIKATAKIKLDTKEYQSTAYAREQETKKGMDEAQITGSASSYARKYALQGLLAISDANDDPDSKSNTTNEEVVDNRKWLNEPELSTYLESFQHTKDLESLKEISKEIKENFRISKDNQDRVKDAFLKQSQLLSK